MPKTQKDYFHIFGWITDVGKTLKNPNLCNRGVREKGGGGGSKSPHTKDLSPTLSFPLSVGCAKSWPQACLLLLQVIYLLVVLLSSHINPGVPLLATPEC